MNITSGNPKVEKQTKEKIIPSVKNLEIWQPKRCLVVEHIDEINGESVIRRGSHLNCGACGGSVGYLNSSLSFPFPLKALKDRLVHSRLSFSFDAVRCKRKPCKALLFDNQTQIVFSDFATQFKPTQIEARTEAVEEIKRFNTNAKRNLRIEKVKNFILMIFMKFRKIQSFFKRLFS